MTLIDTKGHSAPLGATVFPTGTNFSLYAREAIGVDLLFFDQEDQANPSRTVSFDPVSNLTAHYWHAFVPGIAAGQMYAYRVHGPFDPAQGLRFDPEKALLDPYGKAVVTPKNYSRQAASVKGNNFASAMKSVVVDPCVYDWEDDTPLRTPSTRTIIYELHVRGFTRHPNSDIEENLRGTFRGLIERIPYLQHLGITAVELLPVFAFDAQDCPPGLVNYWGYAPVNFFSPHPAYSSRRGPLGPVDEFRDMVKALHRAGIEVILDVVFNHTAENKETGPTLSFRGIDNAAYYVLDEDRSRYADFSGTGNTLNAGHPVARRMIVDSLRYWVQEMHVDGFRFDLASILARDSSGNVLSNPPLLWDIDSDPTLSGTKFIAEAWDAAGLYQVGSFVGDSWREWNGKFRDDMRDFFRANRDSVGSFAERYIGSPDLYGHKEREAEQSINFITCHDGFTLNDLVSYDHKHNEANREQNRDGTDDNRSWNCGVEGSTDDPEIEKLRNRQVKNFLTATLLSIGMPMVSMGDEVRSTQQGNNNAYCQDNEISWFDWSLLNKHGDVQRFLRLLIGQRLRRDLAPEMQRLTLVELLHQAQKEWHGVKLHQPDWGPDSHSIAFGLDLPRENLHYHNIFNAFWEPLDFELPRLNSGEYDPWRRWIDTSLDSPQDISLWHAATVVPGFVYRAAPRSVVVLWAQIRPR